MFFYNLAHHKSKRNHYLALFFAIALHSLILLNQGIRTNSFDIQKQTINVSLVAKSSLAINNENFFHSKNKSQENENKLTKPKLISKSTFGKTSENAIAKNSADVVPVFDAKKLNNPSPIYPEIARQRGIEGDVFLKVLVSSEGRALKVEIIKSSGSQMLDFSAQDTIKNWRFIPASLDNQAVEANVIVPISFKII